MKLSALTPVEVLAFLRLEEDDDLPADMLLTAAKSYVKGYTGLTDEELDQYEDITVAVLVICADLYENRLLTVESGNVNRVIDAILSMHSKNLL